MQEVCKIDLPEPLIYSCIKVGNTRWSELRPWVTGALAAAVACSAVLLALARKHLLEYWTTGVGFDGGGVQRIHSSTPMFLTFVTLSRVPAICG